MKRSKTTSKLVILAIVGISVLGILPTMTQATKPIIPGFPGYMGKGPTISIAPDGWFFPFPPSTFYNPDLAGNPSYFVAHMDWHEMWADFWPRPPYKIKLYIDDEEINMIRFCYHQKDPIIPFMEVGSHNWIFTTTFDADYFEEGEQYEVRVEYWVQKPYLWFDSNEWRIFTFFGPGGYFGEWSFTYTLIIDAGP
ncbi:MAG: hypothetical protein HWN80_07805 [Candidatus Lokiarchaeota archaeon]|nr:hypothetical protein [Candidatus Lokiarchaeota archaeon]